MDFFETGLTLSLVIALCGILWRLSAGCRSQVGTVDTSCSARLLAACKGPLIALTIKLPRTIAALVADILFLARTGQRSVYRWLMHSLIFFGFLGLLLFHAMDSTVTVAFFGDYESTLDPWQWLRNLFGCMALCGLLMALLRRLLVRGLASLSRIEDWALIGLLTLIMFSGLLLESSKMLSPAVYDRMIEEYGYVEEPEEVAALKAFWAGQGVVFAQQVSLDPAVLELGAEINEDSCAGCHSDTSSAFLSRPLASALSPISPALSSIHADLVFYYLHVALCFLGIALLPWGKFIHPLATPANLMARGINRRTEVGDTIAEARRGLGLDACTRCGECSLHCSVRPVFDVLGNADILPSEKLRGLHAHALSPLTGQSFSDFSEGCRICTECHRCTEICSAGIDLQDLWMTSKKSLSGPHQMMRKLTPVRISELFSEGDDAFNTEGSGGCLVQGLADKSESFQGCVQCTTCTSVCPVVAVSEDPTRDLDLMPQQIMNLLRMGLKDKAMSARMVWSCTTCYKCQEHCPQDIAVADILFELRNLASCRLRNADLCGDNDGEGRV